MPQAGHRGDTGSFVLRLWAEPALRESPDWRWKAHHVQSGEKHGQHVRVEVTPLHRCEDFAADVEKRLAE